MTSGGEGEMRELLTKEEIGTLAACMRGERPDLPPITPGQVRLLLSTVQALERQLEAARIEAEAGGRCASRSAERIESDR